MSNVVFCCRMMRKRLMIRNTLLAILVIIGFNEYFIYYVVQYKCKWPSATDALNMQPVKALIISDTHLLGRRRGHWADKLRREWQMHRAFQTAITLHNPEVVFVLGDLFDEGLWSNQREFNEDHERFTKLFKTPQDTKTYVVAGNHDVGFHYEIFKPRTERFASKLDAPPVKLISIRNVHFVLINSMAMEGDGCYLCEKARYMLNDISDTLKCWNKTRDCSKTNRIEEYSRPILMQHFPLYRTSDRLCNEWDSAIGKERTANFKEKWDCLSKESTDLLKNMLDFREAWSGHTHHGCIYKHHPDVFEYTVASFSWRNRNNPSYILAEFTPEHSFLYKCAIPKESTVIILYSIIASSIIIYWFLICCNRLRCIKYKIKT